MSPGLASSRCSVTIAFPPERRIYSRYPVELGLSYRLSGSRQKTLEGVGNTLNLSTGGVLFSAGQSLPAGSDAEVSLEWPASWRADCPLRLILTAFGKVVRSSETGTAVSIMRWESRILSPQACA